MRRRTFLKAAPVAAMGPAGAASAGDGIRLGFDSYSIRNFHWKAMRLIDYADSHKLDTIQISSLDDYESLDPAHLQKVKDRAARFGMKIDGGIGSICPTSGSWRPRWPTTTRSHSCPRSQGAERHGPLPKHPRSDR